MKGVLQKLVKMTKRNDVIVAVMLLLYVLVDVGMPSMVNNVVNSNMGAGVLVISVIYLFLKVNNPVLAVLAFLAVYELMRRAKMHHKHGNVVGIDTLNNVMKSNNPLSNFQYTLEEFAAENVKKEGDSVVGNFSNDVEPLSSAPLDASPV